jgi:hypothetical protein
MDWICITDKLPGFTKGNIYKAYNFNADISKELNSIQLYDNSEYIVIVPLYIEEEIINFRFSQRHYGAPKNKKLSFMRLVDWRESQINKILDNNIN